MHSIATLMSIAPMLRTRSGNVVVLWEMLLLIGIKSPTIIASEGPTIANIDPTFAINVNIGPTLLHCLLPLHRLLEQQSRMLCRRRRHLRDLGGLLLCTKAWGAWWIWHLSGETAKVRLLGRWSSAVETVVQHGFNENGNLVTLRVLTARGWVNTQDLLSTLLDPRYCILEPKWLRMCIYIYVYPPAPL